jgi:hypothetical protein
MVLLESSITVLLWAILSVQVVSVWHRIHVRCFLELSDVLFTGFYRHWGEIG